jgi:hypothetical protein
MCRQECAASCPCSQRNVFVVASCPLRTGADQCTPPFFFFWLFTLWLVHIGDPSSNQANGIAMPEEIAGLDRQSATLRRGIERLIDSYAEGVIEKSEFTPRIAGLKQRLSQLEERRQAAEDAAGLERDLSLIISRMEDFAEKVVMLDC